MVKKNKLFKNKLQMIIYILLMIIILILFIVIGKHDFNKNISTEAEKFNQIFTNVPKENVFKFSNAQEVNNIINSKKSKGIILFGFKANNWTSYYIIILFIIKKNKIYKSSIFRQNYKNK